MINRRGKRILFPALLGMLIVFGAAISQTGFLPRFADFEKRLEWLVYDLRMRLTVDDSLTPDPRIVIVNIDEKSLRRVGRWPWSRRVVGQLVDKLFAGGVAVIGFDVLFAEAQTTLLEELEHAPDGTMSADVRRVLAQFNERMDNDRSFARSLSGGAAVLGYTFLEQAEPVKGLLPEPVYPIAAVAPEDLMLMDYPSYVSNIDILREAAGGAGFFTVIPDQDGVTRRAPLLVRHAGDLYDSLALAIVRKAMQTEDVILKTGAIGDRQAVETVLLDDALSIPTDGAGSVLIPYRGRMGSFRYLSASDVLDGAVPTDTLKNTIVLIGTTAAGLYDLRSTPVQSVYPGVEIHANIIAGILDNRIPSEPPWAPGANLVVIVCLGLIAAWLFPFLDPFGLAFTGLSSIAAVIGATTWLWTTDAFLLATATPVLMILSITVLNFAYGYLAEGKNRRKLKAAFAQYVPPERVEEMSRNPDGAFGVDGESRDMSVLFCDIRGFTTISESLAADELKRMLNHFFTPMTRIIFDSGGTIDKYVGDMIMAFWGAPLADERHSIHAIEAALGMLVAVQNMGDDFERRGWPRISIGIGINSGLMNVGDMGSEYRRSYTVIGDAVNLGSRLEGLTKYYGVQLIVNETTRAGQDQMLFRQLDRVRVKGKREPVSIYEPLCRLDAAGEDLRREVDSYHQALECYFAARWPEAQQRFDVLAGLRPDSGLYRLYQGRVGELAGAEIIGDWDGVYTHSSK